MTPTPSFRLTAYGFFILLGAGLIGLLADWADSPAVRLIGVAVAVVGIGVGFYGAFVASNKP